MNLIERLDARRGLTDTARGCLRTLLAGLAAAPFEPRIVTRGHFGDVLRWERDGRLWFDALPAREWVLFYFGKTALRTPGLDYATVSGEFPEAVERRDLVVKVRLHDQAEAGAMATFINANLGALQLL